MSEYNSLYIKMKIREERLQHFFLQQPVVQTIDEDWQRWWNSREMYNRQPLLHIPCYHFKSNREAFEQLLKDKDFGSMEHYDKNNECWTFISVFFSENYIEILPMLSLLKNMAGYQDQGETGVAFIYDFCWGCHQVMAYLDFFNQQSFFKNYTSPAEIEMGILQEANLMIEAAIGEFNKQFED